MKCATLLISLLSIALFALTGPAQTTTTAPAIVQASDAVTLNERIGQHVVVEGDVSRAQWSRSGKVMSIRFRGTQASEFQAVVFERHRARFDEAFAGDLSNAVSGARIRIRGTLRLYEPRDGQGKPRPEMTLDHPTQITILLPPATQPTTRDARPDDTND